MSCLWTDALQNLTCESNHEEAEAGCCHPIVATFEPAILAQSTVPGQWQASRVLTSVSRRCEEGDSLCEENVAQEAPGLTITSEEARTWKSAAKSQWSGSRVW